MGIDGAGKIDRSSIPIGTPKTEAKEKSKVEEIGTKALESIKPTSDESLSMSATTDVKDAKTTSAVSDALGLKTPDSKKEEFFNETSIGSYEYEDFKETIRPQLENEKWSYLSWSDSEDGRDWVSLNVMVDEGEFAIKDFMFDPLEIHTEEEVEEILREEGEQFSTGAYLFDTGDKLELRLAYIDSDNKAHHIIPKDLARPETISPVKTETVTIEEKTNETLALLPRLDSKPDSQKEVREQIELAIKDIEINKETYIAQAKEKEAKGEDGSIYLRPQEYLGKGAGKKSGKALEATYIGAHMQINADGKIYIIPKHPDLALGKGSFKKVRTAIEYGTEMTPTKVVAFASMSGQEMDEIAEAEHERDIYNELTEEAGGQRITMMTYDKRGYVIEKGRSMEKVKTIIPYANQGDLINFLSKGVSPEQKKEVMLQCAQWTMIMHNAGYINADIKPDNFLINIDGDEIEVFVTDLGMSFKEADVQGRIYRGTPIFMPPEMHNEVILDAKKSDIYALGITLFQSYTEQGDIPKFLREAFKLNEDGTGLNVDTFEYTNAWAKFDPKGDDLLFLIKQMVHPEPHLRPSSDEVVNALENIKNGDTLDALRIKPSEDNKESTRVTQGTKMLQKYVGEHHRLMPDDKWSDALKNQKPGTFVIRDSKFADNQTIVSFVNYNNEMEQILLNDIPITNSAGSKAVLDAPANIESFHLRYSTTPRKGAKIGDLVLMYKEPIGEGKVAIRQIRLTPLTK